MKENCSEPDEGGVIDPGEINYSENEMKWCLNYFSET